MTAGSSTRPPITTDFDGALPASGGLDRLRGGLAVGALAEIDADGLRVGALVARPGTVVGPWLVTADEVADPQGLGLRLSVNGVQRQQGYTKDMIFPVARIVAHLSRYTVLEPGDVINTGTPAGVALGLPGTPFLRPGDTVELSIGGLGGQRQTLTQA